MTTRWHKIVFKCGQCENEIPVNEILMAGHGDIALTGYCSSCDGETTLKTHMTGLLHYCIEMDVLHPLEEQMQEA